MFEIGLLSEIVQEVCFSFLISFKKSSLLPQQTQLCVVQIRIAFVSLFMNTQFYCSA